MREEEFLSRIFDEVRQTYHAIAEREPAVAPYLLERSRLIEQALVAANIKRIEQAVKH